MVPEWMNMNRVFRMIYLKIGREQYAYDRFWFFRKLNHLYHHGFIDDSSIYRRSSCLHVCLLYLVFNLGLFFAWLFSRCLFSTVDLGLGMYCHELMFCYNLGWIVQMWIGFNLLINYTGTSWILSQFFSSYRLTSSVWDSFGSISTHF